MNLSYEEMKEINQIQIEIFKAFLSVCEKLNLRYYLIHGSLLGALKYGDFFPFDDDIDIAMPRADYETLLEKGKMYLPAHIFLQSYNTDFEYPLQFAKIRNSNTAFIQPVMRNLNMNKGIYIDLFPLDYFPDNPIKRKILRVKEILYSTRINTRMYSKKESSFLRKTAQFIAKLLCPSWKSAVRKRAELYSGLLVSDAFITTGGKIKERGVPFAWFGDGVKLPFAGMMVTCPAEYRDYLSCIYGNFENYDPSTNYLNSDGTVTVSADIISTKVSYLDF